MVRVFERIWLGIILAFSINMSALGQPATPPFKINDAQNHIINLNAVSRGAGYDLSVAPAPGASFTPQDGTLTTGTATATGNVTWSPVIGASSQYIDTSGYPSASVMLTNIPSGASIVFEASNDATNWTSQIMAGISGSNNSIWGQTTNTGTSNINLFRYFRARVTAYSSGTVTINAALRSTSGVAPSPNVVQSSTTPPADMFAWKTAAVGQVTNIISSLTVTASSAYASGNSVGGLLTFSNINRATGLSVFLQSAVVASKSLQNSQMDLVIFNQNPSSSTCTDKTAFSMAAVDAFKMVGSVSVTNWVASAIGSVGTSQQPPMGMAVPAVTLFGCLITRGTPTFTATSDIQLTLFSVAN